MATVLYRDSNIGRLPFSNLIKRASGENISVLVTELYFGSAATPGTFGGILKRWTGAIWTKAKARIYTTSFVLKTMKVYKEGTWQNVDTL